MKLVYQGHAPIELEPGRVTVVQINNPVVNTDFIQSLRGQKDKVQLLDTELNKVTKGIVWDGDLVLNPGALQKYQSLLEKKILQSVTAAYQQVMDEQARQIFTTMQENLLEIDLPLEVSFDDDLHRLIKYARVHYLSAVVSQPYGIIETDLKLHLELGDCHVVGLNNVFNYVNPHQGQALARLVEGSKLSVLIIQFSESRALSDYENADVYGIDEDFIDWH